MKPLLKSLFALYGPRYAATIVYMLQGTEYQAVPYLRWLWRITDFSAVMKRRTLDNTKAAQMLRLFIILGATVQVLAGLAIAAVGYYHSRPIVIGFGLVVIGIYPLVWAHAVLLPLVLGRYFIVSPKERALVAKSEKIFASHKGHRIAVAGSYGKTSMKELLLVVLGAGLTVAETPANKNVAISHAHFASKLTGDEDVLIIEYGEGRPGDVAAFAANTHPTHGIITGLAPAHLDQYKTLKAAGKDIFSLADYLTEQGSATNVYVNGESESARDFIESSYKTYDSTQVPGWTIEDVAVSIEGTSFKLRQKGRTLNLESGLLGRHQIGGLGLAAVLAMEFGLSDEQIRAGVAQTRPFEHRMQPYRLGGAWIIDDTYNGNIEGIRAGTRLLAELPAKRKIYVSPGLVDQGDETAPVHRTMGGLIAAAKPDIVVLMQNSVTKYIQEGLQTAGYSGDVQLESEPLEFYTHLDKFVAAGDLVLMQNDWTDNYA